jgi:arsenate reductase (glutaredoxin)
MDCEHVEVGGCGSNGILRIVALIGRAFDPIPKTQVCRHDFMLKIFTLSNCSTCRAATKWLRRRGITFKEVAIRETPPRVPELRLALAASNGELRRLFNTAGSDYRLQKLAEKLPQLSPEAALALLAGNGNLVKRPFLVGEGVTLVGFDEANWAAAFGEKR